MSNSSFAPSKEAGEAIEAEVLQLVPELTYVDGGNAWHDARVDELLVPRDELPFGGIVVLEEGTPVEIKAAQRRLNSGSRRGRLQFRKGQHVRLLEAGGSYLLVVYDPQEMRILAMIVIPASLVDEHLPDGEWTSVDRGHKTQPYCQRSWSRFIAPPHSHGGQLMYGYARAVVHLDDTDLSPHGGYKPASGDLHAGLRNIKNREYHGPEALKRVPPRLGDAGRDSSEPSVVVLFSRASDLVVSPLRQLRVAPALGVAS